MKLNIQAYNVELTDWLEQYVDKKIGKLDKYLPDIDEAKVELREEQTRSASDRAIAQVTLFSPRTILRAEERTGDMFASIDAVADKLERRIARYKGKTARNSKRAVAQINTMQDTVEEEADDAVVGEAAESNIARVKRFDVEPMSAEEAVELMELLGHDFYVFLNAETGTINVVYRRREDDYGLLQPEVG